MSMSVTKKELVECVRSQSGLSATAASALVDTLRNRYLITPLADTEAGRSIADIPDRNSPWIFYNHPVTVKDWYFSPEIGDYVLCYIHSDDHRDYPEICFIPFQEFRQQATSAEDG